MRFLTVKLLAATAFSLTLAACVPGTPIEGAKPAVAEVAIQTDNAAHYAGVTDDGFPVATVPVDKVPAQFQMQQVDYVSTEAVGSIIINPTEKFLYYINGKNKALRYGIAVGKAGFQWSGVANITDRTHWPKWTPPAEMIERKPELAKFAKGQPGGPTNPLGARALYLTTNGVDYGYRIHGTPEWFSIGKNASSGCIRMINQDVMDLYNRVQDGAKVVVLNADGSYPEKLQLPPHAPEKKKPAPVVAAAPATPVLNAPVLNATPTTLPEATPLPAASAAPAGTPVVAPAATTLPAPATVAPATVDPATVAPATAAPAAVVPAAPAVPAPAATAPAAVAPTATAPAATAPAATAAPSTCTVALVNGVCPQP